MIKKILIIFIGETTPVDKNTKNYRYSNLEKYLLKFNYNITRIVPNFFHLVKKKRFKNNKIIKINQKHRVVFLKNLSYSSNESILRFISYKLLSFKIKKFLSEIDKPDLIITAIPSPDIAISVMKYANKKKIPVILDIRDDWLNNILNRVGKFKKIANFFINQLLFDMNDLSKFEFTPICTSYIYKKSFINYSRKFKKSTVIPLGYDNSARLKNIYLRKNFLLKKNQKLNMIFAGSLTRSYNLDFLLFHEEKLKKYIKNIYILTNIKDYAALKILNNSKIFKYYGWQNYQFTRFKQLKSDLSIFPSTRFNLTSFPNRFQENVFFLNPILASDNSLDKNIIIKNKIGLIYKNENINSFVQKIKFFYENKSEHKKFKSNCYKFSKRNFCTDVNNKDYLRIIHKLNV